MPVVEWRSRLGARRLPTPVWRWLAFFGTSLGLFLVRFLVPVPVGQSDNRDGPRLMCGLGVGPATGGRPRFFRYIYFEYVTKPGCTGHPSYPSSELAPLAVARVLTPVFRLPGTLNLVALGVVMCVLASVGVASLATGLRLRLWAQAAVAAAVWLVVADAAFFDVFAAPFSEPAALAGLLLVAAGVVYLGREWRDAVFGLALVGVGGSLAVLSKEQYLVWAVPVCLTLVLASVRWRTTGWRQWFAPRQARAAVAVAAVLALMAGAYATWDATSRYAQRLHDIQAVDMVFTDIVTNRATAPAQLRALGLPVGWAKYAGRYYWAKGSVRTDPLFSRYVPELGDTTIVGYLVTHPASVVSIGQQAAVQAQQMRVTSLGDYPPSAGQPPGAYESRVIALTWLVHQLPRRLGLWLYVPLWLLTTLLGLLTLRRRRRPWHRDAAVLVLCMTSCAFVAFLPPAYFAGISTTRHMVGTNLATALALIVAISLAVSTAQAAIPPGVCGTARGRSGR